MLLYDTLYSSEGVDIAKNSKSMQCFVFHYYYFNHRVKFQKSVSNVFLWFIDTGS